MTVNEPVRVGVIGTSWFSDLLHLPALKSHPHARIAAVCGRNPVRAEEMARKYGAEQVFTDYRTMVDKGNLQYSMTDVLLGEEKKEGEGRTLTLLAMSPRKANWITLYVSDAEVLEASVNGKPIPKDPDARVPAQGWRLRFSNPPDQGIEVMLKVRGTQPVKVRAVDGSLGLPDIAGMNLKPRPDWLMPAHTGDVTLVTRAFTF